MFSMHILLQMILFWNNLISNGCSYQLTTAAWHCPATVNNMITIPVREQRSVKAVYPLRNK